MRWDYVVRQRHRWSFDVAARRRQTERLQDDLKKIGVTKTHLKRLHGIVEVAVPDWQHDSHWESRILPWEYVLAAATNAFRGEKPILVVRHLMTGRTPRKRSAESYAIVETAPGALRPHFEFSAERSLVTGCLAELRQEPLDVISNPTKSTLERDLTSHSPDIIHLSGVDNRSGRKTLKKDLAGVRDGLYLAGGSDAATEVRAESIAEVLNSGHPNPLFIGFNCWDSGARLAPMTIHEGAESALAFQHTFDDAVSEVFFLNFYRASLHSDWNLLTAFTSAWESISSYRRRIRGSSIILWSAHSLLKGAAYKQFVQTRSDSSLSLSTASAPQAQPDKHRIQDLVSVSVRPKQQLNYSLLHNGRSLFEEFALRLHGDVKSVSDLEVEVHLHVGTESFPFRTRLKLGTGEPRYDLAATDDRFAPQFIGNPVGGIRLPLTSPLIRSISERIQTGLYVKVSWHDQVLYQHTHPVWLSPVDEWTLNDQDIWWLPSFVQPRDPAVNQTLDSAQNYLRCLADRSDAGFDGYQSYDDHANGLEQWAGVDRQVRSIWSALAMRQTLSYINPPPSYADHTQRLRTPSQTINGKRGTCIDLAILMASCLEWIEVYPVLFMLNDHAFVGYWRDLMAYKRFLDVMTEGVAQSEINEESRDDHRGERWIAWRIAYPEVKGFVDRGELIPLETVLLTSGGGFTAAIEEGRAVFRNARNHAFHSMIDISSARQGNGITPLPLFQPSEIQA